MVKVAKCVTYNKVLAYNLSVFNNFHFQDFFINIINNIIIILLIFMHWSCKVVGIFGFTGEDHIGKVSFPPVQVWITTFNWNNG